MSEKLPEIKVVELSSVKNWELNPREALDFKRLKDILTKRGQIMPLILDGRDGATILGGNMRLRAMTELGWKNVAVSVVYPNSDKDAVEMAFEDNETFGKYVPELVIKLALDYGLGHGIRITQDNLKLGDLIKKAEADKLGEYTKKVEAPIYEPKGDNPKLAELFDDSKAKALDAEIAEADVPPEVRAFLFLASMRFVKFNYKRIADYYAQAPANIKKLMERLALVIIDYDKAIENGFVEMVKELDKIQEYEEDEQGQE